MTITLKTEISVAWWVRWYLRALIVRAYLINAGPNPDRVAARVMRGIRTRVIAVPRG